MDEVAAGDTATTSSDPDTASSSRLARMFAAWGLPEGVLAVLVVVWSAEFIRLPRPTREEAVKRLVVASARDLRLHQGFGHRVRASRQDPSDDDDQEIGEPWPRERWGEK